MLSRVRPLVLRLYFVLTSFRKDLVNAFKEPCGCGAQGHVVVLPLLTQAMVIGVERRVVLSRARSAQIGPRPKIGITVLGHRLSSLRSPRGAFDPRRQTRVGNERLLVTKPPNVPDNSGQSGGQELPQPTDSFDPLLRVHFAVEFGNACIETIDLILQPLERIELDIDLQEEIVGRPSQLRGALDARP